MLPDLAIYRQYGYFWMTCEKNDYCKWIFLKSVNEINDIKSKKNINNFKFALHTSHIRAIMYFCLKKLIKALLKIWPTFTIYFTEVQFQLGHPQPPASLCSLPCLRGQMKKYVEGESCCWTCHQCGQYQVR